MHVFILHRFSVKSGSPEAPRPKLPLFRFVKWLRLRYIALLYLPTFLLCLYLPVCNHPQQNQKKRTLAARQVYQTKRPPKYAKPCTAY